LKTHLVHLYSDDISTMNQNAFCRRGTAVLARPLLVSEYYRRLLTLLRSDCGST